jgi:hypothetical protein
MGPSIQHYRPIFTRVNVSSTWTPIDTEYSFDWHSQVSQGNIVKGTQDFNLDDILLATTCVSSIWQFSPIFTKMNDSPLENAERYGLFFWEIH